MRLVGVAAFAAGLLFAQQSAASSFVVLDDVPPGPSRSIIVLGEPARLDPPVVSASPDDTIRTAALPHRAEAPGDAVVPQISASTDGRPSADRHPRLSVSMIALGEPSAISSEAATSSRQNAPFALPMVIRGGLVGDAHRVVAAPSTGRPAAIEQSAGEQTGKPAETKSNTPALAERRGSSPSDRPSKRDKSPEPAALPPAPPPPPPPTQRLE